MPAPFVLCDVFAERPFAGNPLAVFLDADDISDEVMADLGREFGWSEITFVQGPDPRVRIWTPVGELPFAGHPTVGTAVVLASQGRIPRGPNTLQLLIGPVDVDIHDAEAGGGSATMFQRAPEFGATFVDRRRLAQALGLAETDLSADLPAQVVSTGLPHFLVPLRSLDALQRVQADANSFPRVAADAGVRWIYTFTADTPGDTAGARARLIAPQMEDAATGSAAGPLGAYLVQYGVRRAGEIQIVQGVEMGRPSLINVDVSRIEGNLGPVQVSGQVKIWANGHLDTPARAVWPK
ncbi:MAG TPA: PhzF family phenazine biosynthesis protein [Chloroflexota bacterium]